MESGHSPNPSRSHSILEGLGGDSRDGVTAGQFKWNTSYTFTFSLRNQLSDPISDVSCVIVFYDRNKVPVDSKLLKFDDTIPPGLAKRVKNSHVETYLDPSVKDLVEERLPNDPAPYDYSRAEDPQSGAVEFRILDFRVLK
jgi:hypothetical protein